MKSTTLFLACLSLVHSPIICVSKPVLLGKKSKNDVITSGIIGATIGAAGAATLHYLISGFDRPSRGEIVFGVSYAAFWGLLSSAISYHLTPESEFNAARNTVEKLLEDPIYQAANRNTSSLVALDEIKKILFKEKFPLFTAFKKLEAMYNTLETAKNTFQKVSTSHRDDLAIECNIWLVAIFAGQPSLQQLIVTLKADPNFITECNAASMEKIHHAQASAANALWWQVLMR